ncbi:hypothetical protein Ddc_23166 [Ditylenchus destructor]|nr:hypothetical protein Ddc_23166 [Ditylenchus destructor]
MSKYCHVKEDGYTTHYSGVLDSRSDHIVDELQASHEAKKLKEAEKRSNAVKRPKGTTKSDSDGLKPRRQVGFLQRSDSERSGIPRDPRSVPANLTTKETDTQTDCKDHYENVVQTEGGMTRAQLEEKLQNSEAQLQQMSEENRQLKNDLRAEMDWSEGTIFGLDYSLDKTYVELCKSETINQELLEYNRNLEAKLGQLDLKLKVILKEFAENLESDEIWPLHDLLKTMSAELEAEPKRPKENVKNTEMSANANSFYSGCHWSE